MTGTVVVSLDFELGWGHRTIRPEYVAKLRNETDVLHERILALIDLFERYDIPATWAVVGKLLSHGSDPLFHDHTLFETLLSSAPDHEIGLHSHQHQPFDELTLDEARDDVEAGLAALREWDCTPQSFVFPRNRVAHLEVLREHGFTHYRDASSTSRAHRIAALWWPDVVDLPLADEIPVGVPETTFLAARRPSWFLHRSIKRGLRRAAATDGMVHYWLHPHNVVTDPSLLETLGQIFSTINEFRTRGTIEARTIGSI